MTEPGILLAKAKSAIMTTVGLSASHAFGKVINLPIDWAPVQFSSVRLSLAPRL
jgi:hypothetical protein